MSDEWVEKFLKSVENIYDTKDVKKAIKETIHDRERARAVQDSKGKDTGTR